MTQSVGIHEAKTHLSRLLEELTRSGEEIVITNRGVPVARLVLLPATDEPQLGLDEGVFDLPPDFDEPWPELVGLFEGS